MHPALAGGHGEVIELSREHIADPLRVVEWSTIRRLYDLTAGLNGQRGLASTLQAVVDGVEGIGFGVAVVNIVQGDGLFETVAVAGPPEVRETLLGRRNSPATFAAEFAVAEHWGALRFVPHGAIPADEVSGWIPDMAISDDPDAWHPLDALYAPLTGPSGDLVGMLSVDMPVSGRLPDSLQRALLEVYAMHAGIAINNARLGEELRREHAHLQASESSFRLAFDNAGTPMAMMSVQPDDLGRFLRVNEAFARMLGYSRDELMGLSVQQVTHQDERASEAELVERVDDGETVLRRVQKKYVRKDGEVVWVSVTSTVVQDESGLPWYLISQYMDVTEVRRRELELDAEVRTDVLTGLGNRLALEDRLTRLSPDRRTALLFCDLDGYKAVNDAYGHLVGDGTLVAIGHRLLAAVREEDLVVRLGGDEFVVVSDGLGCRTLAEMAERIRVSIARPIDIRGVPVSITVSIGVASARAGDTADSVIDRADALMYQVKTAGKDGFRLAEDIWDELVV